MFKDRRDAGTKLALKLRSYKDSAHAIVLGLPRGGVVVAYEVAKQLNLPLDIIVACKISLPINPEMALGAITSDGETVFDNEIIQMLQVGQDYIDHEVEKEKKEALRRLACYRKNKKSLSLQGKIVILIDDGVATGATMKVAIKSVSAMGAKKIIIAIPVAPPEFIQEIKKKVDAVICLEEPEGFVAVGAYYENFAQVKDAEVIDLLNGIES